MSLRTDRIQKQWFESLGGQPVLDFHSVCVCVSASSECRSDEGWQSKNGVEISFEVNDRRTAKGWKNHVN